MFSKKKVYIFLTFLTSVIVLLLVIQPARRCNQCGHPIYRENPTTNEVEIFRESLMARIFSTNSSFLHLICVQDYLDDHPIERDENGNIIPKM